jgi:hypothetical protein
MQPPLALKPQDICIGLQLVLTPEAGFRELADSVGLSLGETHNSVSRLDIARLVMPHRRAAHIAPLLELIIHGVPYVFPAHLGSDVQGVPTAWSGPALRDQIHSPVVVVWPSEHGMVRGNGIAPLYNHAAELPSHNPALYRWLTLVDAIRVGRARERELGRGMLEEEVAAGAPGG